MTENGFDSDLGTAGQNWGAANSLSLCAKMLKSYSSVSAAAMPFPKGQNPNHPAAGSTIKVEPIRDKKAIQRIKKILANRPRDLCLLMHSLNSIMATLKAG